MLIKAYKAKPLFFTLFSILYVIIAAIIINAVTERFVDKQVEQTKQALQYQLSLVRSNIEASIFRDTYLADSLATVVTIDPLFAVTHWESVAGKLLAKAKFVRNVGLAPNNVISQVYPVKGNEEAIGLDFRTNPQQYQSVQKARQLQEVFIAGPLELVQGGTALIARYPIFTDAPYNNEYWGGVSVVLDYDKVLASSGLLDIHDLEIALVSNSDNNVNKRVIFGDPGTITAPDIKFPISLPNGTWEVYATYKGLYEADHIIRFKRFFVFLGAVTFFCGYTLIAFLFRNYIKAHQASFQDELTKLPNRRYLLSELERLMSNKHTIIEFTVLNIDMNGFKQVNDSLGHEAGDALLKHVSDKLRGCLRSSDIISRFGGDEFVAVLYRTTQASDVEKIIQKIHACLDSSPLSWGDAKITPSLSIGYSSFRGKGNSLMIKEILAEADKNMYQDKMTRKLNADYSI
jgi:diguanylate cyclase (GGDEF)-like protein